MSLPTSSNKISSLFLALALSVSLLAGCSSSSGSGSSVAGGGSGGGGGGSSDAPRANPDAYNTLGNATLNQSAANGVLVNDQVNGATITAFDSQSAQGGTVTLQSDGGFLYTPVIGFNGTDSFKYTLASTTGTSSTTVTLSVNNQAIFVNNTLTANGDGTQVSPFNNLADALSAASSGDTVFVFTGDGTSKNQAGAFTIPVGVNLVGQGSGLTLNQSLAPQGQPPLLTGPITALGANTISGFSIAGSASSAIVANNINGIVVSENHFRNNTDEHLSFKDLTGTVTVDNNTFEANAGDGQDCINFNNNNSDVSLTLAGNSFEDDAPIDPEQAIDLVFRGSSVATLSIDSNRFTSPNNASSYDDAIYVQARNTSDVTATISNNAITNSSNNAINLTCADSGASFAATISGNTISDPEDRAIECNADDGTMNATISENTIDGGVDGIWGGLTDSNKADLTIVVSGNIITNVTQVGIRFAATENDGNLSAAIRNNNITGSGVASVDALLSASDAVCLDITDNTVNNDMTFRVPSGPKIMYVERLESQDGGPLRAVNTFQDPAIVTTVGDVRSAPIGTCAIP